MKKKAKHARTTSRARTTQPETNSSLRNARAAVSEQNALSPPYVVGPPLNDPAPLTFVDFLQLKHTKELFGMRGDVADMLGGLTSQPDFLKASISKKANKTAKAQWKKLLSEHVRRSYLGDRRGMRYWTRVSKVIWVAYENMLSLQLWAKRALTGEVERLARWQVRAEKERARQRTRRARSKPSRAEAD